MRGRASVVGHVPFDRGTTIHDCRGLLSLLSSGGRWYRCARGKQVIVPKRGVARRIGGRRFSLSRSSLMILAERRSKVYHEVHHGGRLIFHGVCGFYDYTRDYEREIGCLRLFLNFERQR